MLPLILAALSGAQVRIFHLSDGPWFAANDLILALGLPRHDLDHYLACLGEDERRRLSPGPGLAIGNSGLTCVSLSGFFRLLLRCDTPAAVAFQDWACRDVLPVLWKSAMG